MPDSPLLILPPGLTRHNRSRVDAYTLPVSAAYALAIHLGKAMRASEMVLGYVAMYDDNPPALSDAALELSLSLDMVREILAGTCDAPEASAHGESATS